MAMCKDLALLMCCSYLELWIGITGWYTDTNFQTSDLNAYRQDSVCT